MIVTTVHALADYRRALPETEHDFRVDAIITAGKIAAIPALTGRAPGRPERTS